MRTYGLHGKRSETVGIVLAIFFGFFAHLYSGRFDKFSLSLGLLIMTGFILGFFGLSLLPGIAAALITWIYALVVITQDVREYNKKMVNKRG